MKKPAPRAGAGLVALYWLIEEEGFAVHPTPRALF